MALVLRLTGKFPGSPDLAGFCMPLLRDFLGSYWLLEGREELMKREVGTQGAGRQDIGRSMESPV